MVDREGRPPTDRRFQLKTAGARRIGPTKWLHPAGHPLPPVAAVDLSSDLLEKPVGKSPTGSLVRDGVVPSA